VELGASLPTAPTSNGRNKSNNLRKQKFVLINYCFGRKTSFSLIIIQTNKVQRCDCDEIQRVVDAVGLVLVQDVINTPSLIIIIRINEVHRADDSRICVLPLKGSFPATSLSSCGCRSNQTAIYRSQSPRQPQHTSEETFDSKSECTNCLPDRLAICLN
jgi:hypothetical protein